MHWRHIKWRAPWQKRHLSVLERFRAEDAAQEKAAFVQKYRDETARYITLERLENRESMWDRCKHSIRSLRDGPWQEPDIGREPAASGGETAKMIEEKNMNNEDIRELDSMRELWEGDYTSVLADYGIS
ncbi:hypothetical protein G6011_01773 [Alternaria panax]|uniref:Uncharacterized protein n=1 Tax=Alternaria panax TaxID=48097 RepID=A0AAD4IL80_9PLEO|nr:hypothetical protein G6011_01773 [Alternaria panax]